MKNLKTKEFTLLICNKCGEIMRAECFSDKFPGLSNQPIDSITLLHYNSPSGHNHDDNCLTRTYMCSNRHTLKVGKRRTCPACNWKGKEKCNCHEGMKFDEFPDSL